MSINTEITHVYRIAADGSGYQVGQFRTLKDAHLMCVAIEANSDDRVAVDLFRAGEGQNVVSWSRGEDYLAGEPAQVNWWLYLEYRKLTGLRMVEAWRTLYGWHTTYSYTNLYSGPTVETLAEIKKILPDLHRELNGWVLQYADTKDDA